MELLFWEEGCHRASLPAENLLTNTTSSSLIRSEESPAIGQILFPTSFGVASSCLVGIASDDGVAYCRVHFSLIWDFL